MKKKILVLTVSCVLCVSSISFAAPQLINYQGNLLDSGGGPIFNPALPMTFRIYDAQTGGTLQWSETQTVRVLFGAFNVLLGNVTPLNQATFDNNDNLWIELQIDTDPPLTPRQRLSSSPFALQANRADQANMADSVPWTGVAGVPANISDIATLNCAANQVAKLNSAATAWECADDAGGISVETDPTVQANVKDGVDWTELSGIPVGFADNIDDVGILTEVDPNVPLELHDGAHWIDLINIPSDIADGDDVGILTEIDPTVNVLGKAVLACGTDQVAKFNGTIWACADDVEGISVETDPTVQVNVKDGVDWTELSGIPAGFADDIDDVGILTEVDPTVNALGNATLACAADQVAKWNGTTWECANDTVGISVEVDPTVNSLATASLPCSANQIAQWNGTNWICADDNVGIAVESDPTVQANVKDGVDWTELSGIPADVADGDDVGILTEVDPTVNELGNAVLNCNVNQIARWDGSNWVCAEESSGVSGIPSNIQAFTSSGTWIKPDGVDVVYVKVWGGGASGAGNGGRGGGGGGYAEGLIAVTGNVIVTVGGVGATSSFAGTTTIQATGGSGANGGVGSNGTVNLTGGRAGFGRAGIHGMGGPGGGSPLGGAGGGVIISDGSNDPFAGAPGTFPGGGGGGSVFGGQPGAGAAGLVIVMY